MNDFAIEAAYRAIGESLVKKYAPRLKSRSRAEDCLQEAVIRLLEVGETPLVVDVEEALQVEMKKAFGRAQDDKRRDRRLVSLKGDSGEDPELGQGRESSKNLRSAGGEVLIAPGPSPEEEVAGLVTLEHLSESLTGWRKDVFELTWVLGMPLSIVAERTGVSYEATKQRVARLRKELLKTGILFDR